jgi:hypothetical protein
VSISCREICLILLRDLRFGVRSLQKVSVDFVPRNLFDFAEGPVRSLQAVSIDFVPRNLFDFAEGPVVRYVISTGSECPLSFLFWLIFLIISADRSYYTLLFSGALHIILIVSDLLLRSCWLTVCEFAAKPNVYSHLGSLISHVCPLLVAQCQFLHRCSP